MRYAVLIGADTGPDGAESGYPAGFRIFHNGKAMSITGTSTRFAGGDGSSRAGGAGGSGVVYVRVKKP